MGSFCDGFTSVWHQVISSAPVLNLLAPGRFYQNLRKIIFKLLLVTDGCDISSKITLRWTSLDLSDDKSALDQVMAWCRQATIHYLNQCWRRSLPPYGIYRPQWVNCTSLNILQSDFNQMPNIFLGKMYLNMWFAKAQPSDSGLNMLTQDTYILSQKKCTWKCPPQNDGHFV